jgi:hypothetical protein
MATEERIRDFLDRSYAIETYHTPKMIYAYVLHVSYEGYSLSHGLNYDIAGTDEMECMISYVIGNSLKCETYVLGGPNGKFDKNGRYTGMIKIADPDPDSMDWDFDSERTVEVTAHVHRQRATSVLSDDGV